MYGITANSNVKSIVTKQMKDMVSNDVIGAVFLSCLTTVLCKTSLAHSGTIQYL